MESNPQTDQHLSPYNKNHTIHSKSDRREEAFNFRHTGRVRLCKVQPGENKICSFTEFLWNDRVKLLLEKYKNKIS